MNINDQRVGRQNDAEDFPNGGGQYKPPVMRHVLTLVFFRTVVLGALAASSALLYDYVRPLPAFCETGAGCEKVRESAYAYVMGVPQPVFGLVGLAVLFGISLAPHAFRMRWLAPVATLGAVAGIGFLAIQAFHLQAYCYLCVITDVLAPAAAVLAWLHRAAPREASDGAVPRSVWILAAALSIAVPFGFGSLQPQPSVPPAVARLWTAGKVNIVELSDFECPFCRMLHVQLIEALEPYGDKVELTRITVPLPSHKYAREASSAYLCAKQQGYGEAMAHELFEEKELSSAVITQKAQDLQSKGLNLELHHKCMTGADVDREVDEEIKKAKEIGFRGLPTIWIGEQVMVGARPANELRAAIDQQAEGASHRSVGIPEGWLWTLLIAAFVALALVAIWLSPERKARAAA